MAVLSSQDRIDVWAGLMRRADLGEVAISKADLKAALHALDTWLDGAAATINAAIPQPARGSLTARQKALLLMAVIAKRYDRS